MTFGRLTLTCGLVGCTPEDTDTSAEVLANLLSAPHDCAIEEAIRAPGDDLGDCYRRTAWRPACDFFQDGEIDTSPVLAIIPTYGFDMAATFTITDQPTLDAFVESIPASEVEPPTVDFDTHIVAGIYDHRSGCGGNSVENGVYFGANRPIIYYRFHDATGACNAQCDGVEEVVYLYALTRTGGFPSFCIEQLDTCTQ